MWRNTAFESFVEWLKDYNAARKAEAMGGSIRAGMLCKARLSRER